LVRVYNGYFIFRTGAIAPVLKIFSPHIGRFIPKCNALKDQCIGVGYWTTFNTRQALVNDLISFYRDTPGNGSVLNRQNNTANDQRTLNAIIAGGQ